MLSIQKYIEEYLNSNILLLELLSKNLLNSSQLADNLQLGLEQKTLKKVSRNTIIVAINRFRKKLQNQNLSQIKVKKITGAYPVFWHYLKFKTYTNLINFLSEVEISKNDLCVFKNNKLVIVAKTKEKNIRQIECNQELVEKKYRDELCEIKIEFPNKILPQTGFLYKVSSLLSWRGYSIIDMHVLQNKLYLYLKQKDFSGVLEVLKQNFETE